MEDEADGRFRFCPRCATLLERQFHSGRMRPTCPACGFRQYQNPAVGVAIILVRDDTVLLGRRAGSYRGQWCIPCGYVEWDEDVRQAAEREFLEETGLRVQAGAVYAVHSNFHNRSAQTVGVWFLGSEAGGSLAAGDDLDEVRFFGLTALPAALAFPTDRLVLEQLLVDQRMRAAAAVAVNRPEKGWKA